jgi:hypothetical protein
MAVARSSSEPRNRSTPSDAQSAPARRRPVLVCGSVRDVDGRPVRWGEATVILHGPTCGRSRVPRYLAKGPLVDGRYDVDVTDVWLPVLHLSSIEIAAPGLATTRVDSASLPLFLSKDRPAEAGAVMMHPVCVVTGSVTYRSTALRGALVRATCRNGSKSPLQVEVRSLRDGSYSMELPAPWEGWQVTVRYGDADTPPELEATQLGSRVRPHATLTVNLDLDRCELPPPEDDSAPYFAPGVNR